MKTLYVLRIAGILAFFMCDPSILHAQKKVIEIIDGKTIYRINVNEKPVDATAARQMIYTIGMALPAATREVAKYNDQEEKLKPVVSKHLENVTTFVKDQENLKSDWAKYNTEVKPYNEESERYSSAVAVYNAGSQKTKEEFTRFTNWKSELDRRHGPLEYTYNSLNTRQQRLESTRSALSIENDQLAFDLNNIKANRGKALGQLQALHKHAEEINKYLKDHQNWKVAPVKETVIKGAYEEIKESSNLEFDGNTKQKKLTEVKKTFTAKPNN